MFAFIAHAIAHEEVSCFALVAVVVRDRWFMLWGARKLAVKYKRFSWLRACAPLIVCAVGILIGATWSELGGCNFEYCDKNEKPKCVFSSSSLGSAGLRWQGPA